MSDFPTIIAFPAPMRDYALKTFFNCCCSSGCFELTEGEGEIVLYDYMTARNIADLIRDLKAARIPFDLTECDTEGRNIQKNFYRPDTANAPGGYWEVPVVEDGSYVWVYTLRKLLESPDDLVKRLAELCDERDPRPYITPLAQCIPCVWLDHECGDCPGTSNEWGPAGVGCCTKFSEDEDFEELERGCPDCQEGILSPSIDGFRCDECNYQEGLSGSGDKADGPDENDLKSTPEGFFKSLPKPGFPKQHCYDSDSKQLMSQFGTPYKCLRKIGPYKLFVSKTWRGNGFGYDRDYYVVDTRTDVIKWVTDAAVVGLPKVDKIIQYLTEGRGW